MKQAISIFPVLTVELMDVDPLAQKVKNPQKLNKVIQDLMLRFENQLVAQGAWIDSLKDRVITFSFPYGETPGEAISRAIKIGILLAQKRIVVGGVPLRMRVGFDLESTGQRTPTRAVPERLVAQSGELVVSHAAFLVLSKKLPFEAIGPVRVQGQMQTFFKLMLKRPEESVAPEPIVTQAAAPIMEPPVEPVMQPVMEPIVEPPAAAQETSYEDLMATYGMPSETESVEAYTPSPSVDSPPAAWEAPAESPPEDTVAADDLFSQYFDTPPEAASGEEAAVPSMAAGYVEPPAVVEEEAFDPLSAFYDQAAESSSVSELPVNEAPAEVSTDASMDYMDSLFEMQAAPEETATASATPSGYEPEVAEHAPGSIEALMASQATETTPDLSLPYEVPEPSAAGADALDALLDQQPPAEEPPTDPGLFDSMSVMATAMPIVEEPAVQIAPSIDQPSEGEDAGSILEDSLIDLGAPMSQMSSAPEPLPPLEDELTVGATFERPLSPLEEAPEVVAYQPPQFVEWLSVAKSPNIGYDEAIQTIIQDIRSLTMPAANNAFNLGGMAAPAKGQIIGLCGEEGAGKSFIVNIIRSQLPQENFRWFGGGFYQAFSQQQFPFYYWYEFLLNLTGFPLEGMPQDEARQFMDNILASMFGTDVTEPLIRFWNVLFSIEQPDPITPETRGLMGQMIPMFLNILKAMAAQTPLVLVFEDIHYADAASLELLLQLLQENILDEPIVILLTYTSQTTFKGSLQQAVNLLPFKEYVLSPTMEDTLVAMAEPPLAEPWKKLPEEIRQTIVEQHSPMYLEEAIRWLYNAGGFSIHKKTGKFKQERKLKKLQLPDSLEFIIRERYESLDPVLKYILQMASVLGERFSMGVLSDLVQNQDLSPDQLKEIFQLLWHMGFIVPDAESLARFRHRLIWQTIYDQMEEPLRLKIHQEVAHYFMNGKQRGNSVNPLYIAFHATKGGDTQLASYAWSMAVAWLANIGSVTGANLAYNHYQFSTGASSLVLGTGDQFVQPEQMAVINVDNEPEYAKQMALTLVHQVDVTDTASVQVQMPLFLLLIQVYERLGQYPQATSICRLLQQAVANLPQPEPRLLVSCLEVWYLYLQGKLQEAGYIWTEFVEPDMAQCQDHPLHNPMLQQAFFKAVMAQAFMGFFLCKPDTMALLDDHIEHVRAHHLKAYTLQLKIVKGYGHVLYGQYAKCHELLDPLLSEIETQPESSELMVWWGLVVLLYHCDLGDWQNASLLIPNTAYQAERARDYLAWTLCQTIAGRVSTGLGHYTEAHNILENAISVAAQYYLATAALMGWRFVSQNDFMRSNIGVAQEVIRRAIDVAKKPEITNVYELVLMKNVQSMYWINQHQFLQAQQQLEQVWAFVEGTPYKPLQADTAFQLSKLYQAKAEHAASELEKTQWMEQAQSYLDLASQLWREMGNERRIKSLYEQFEVPSAEASTVTSSES